MKTFKEHMITEAAYPGNLGFSELVTFYQKATPAQLKEMEKIVQAEDWEGFKKIIKKVLKVELQ